MTWGEANRYPTIVTALRDAVQDAMKSASVPAELPLTIETSFRGDDPDVWINFPTIGTTDGQLLEALADPSRFTLKLHTPDAGRQADLINELRDWGFQEVEVVEVPSAPPDIHYGAAPEPLIDRLMAFLRERIGLELGRKRAFSSFDTDICCFIPPPSPRKRNRAPEQSTPSAEPESSANPAAGWRASRQRKQALRKLEPYGRMLTDVDLSGRPPLSREGLFRQLLTALNKMKRRNVIIVGPSGTGKTALVYELARRIQSGDPSLPARLLDQDIFELSPNFLRAGTMYRGQYEERVAALLRVLTANPKIILFVDEIHSMFQSSRHEDDSFSQANESFKSALARGEITVIGCTTTDEYRHAIAPDPALARRFELLTVPPPTTEETFKILQSRRRRLESHYAPLRLGDAILRRVIELTEDYLPTRNQPDKSIQLLDQACAAANLASPERDHLKDEDLFGALEGTLGQKIMRHELLTEAEVFQRLSARVVGQDQVLHQLARSFVAGLTGWKDRRGPRGVFLFAGPTGVGKTESALALAEVLGGGRDALIRIDCNTLGGVGPGTATWQLLGTPAGYQGYVRGQGGLLSRIRDRPEAVILFDELEKADQSVAQLLLQVIDNGRVEDSEGALLDFRRAFLIFTTNAGVTYEVEKPFGFHGTGGSARSGPYVEVQAVHAGLQQRLGVGAEFLGRITHTFEFQGLTRSSIHHVLDQQLHQLEDLARTRGFELTWDEELVDYLTEQWQPQLGVRFLTAILRNRVIEQLSLAEAQGELQGIRRIRLRLAEKSGGTPGSAVRRREGDLLVIQIS